MGKEYVVRKGECIWSIGEARGLLPDMIWSHPDNAKLKELRGEMGLLLAGDVVVIPDPVAKEESCPTEARHKFRRKGIPAEFKLCFMDPMGEPRSGVEFRVLQGIRTVATGQTDGDGFVVCAISPLAKKVTVVLCPNEAREEYEIRLRHLDPIDSLSGVQERLYNLGFFEGEIDGLPGEETELALQAFQEEQGLEPTGQVDASTASALKEAHGS